MFSADLQEVGLEILKFLISNSVEKETDENSYTKKIWCGNLANQCNFAKFTKIFHHKNLYHTVFINIFTQEDFNMDIKPLLHHQELIRVLLTLDIIDMIYRSLLWKRF